nr:hypothetical protein [Micromonospora purpureochromogenes]
MDVSSAPTRYAEALLFAAEVVDAATRPPHGDHGEEVLRDPYAREMLRHQRDWSWCDSRQDVDLAASGALRATVEYVARRHATALPDYTGRAGEHWPDVDDRLARLASALRFAAEAAEQAWPHRLQQVLAPWVRQRLAALLTITGRAEGLGSLDARVRRAVMDRLAATGFDVGEVERRNRDITQLGDAVELVKTHNVVLDATAHAGASSLLATAADIVGAWTGHTVISACVQREGDIIRADRFPLRRAEQHLPALANEPVRAGVREAGCGEPVSRTPPAAVIAAAELACRMIIDEATHQSALPATMADVRRPQPDPPFDRLGLLTSDAVSVPVAL